jgi:hypothetical protein
MVNDKNNEENFFKDAPLESIESIVNTDNWEDNEPVIQNGKKNITRFIFIKIVTIIIIGYIIIGYKLDVEYYFQDIAVKDFGKVTITTLKKIKMEEFKKYNNTVASVSGWIEIENSFSMKLNFKRYMILKLWRKPIFVVLDKDNKSFVPTEGTSSDISYLKPVTGRLLTYNNLSNGISLLNSYDGIVTAYKRATKKQFSKNGVIIIADSLPKQNIWSLIIPSILLLYIFYSIFSIIRIFKIIKKENRNN